MLISNAPEPEADARVSVQKTMSDLTLFIHEVVWSELMGGDEAVGLA